MSQPGGPSGALGPMEVQLVVGLLCCRHHPEAVAVTVGDMVQDAAAQKRRDVDVTIVHAEDTAIAGVTALEVKQEARPLDVQVVEQLAQKLADMPSIRHPGIVSTSGFTSTAAKKAAAHGVTLYTLEDWDDAVQARFPHLSLVGTPRDSIHSVSVVYEWHEVEYVQVNPESDHRERLVPVLRTNPPVLTAQGEPHPRFSDVASFMEGLTKFALDDIVRRGAMPVDINEAWRSLSDNPAEATTVRRQGLDSKIAVDLDVAVQVEQELIPIDSVRVRGIVSVKAHRIPYNFKIMTDLAGSDPFAGAAVTTIPGSEEHLMAIVFSPTDSWAATHTITLTPTQRNALRRLRLR